MRDVQSIDDATVVRARRLAHLRERHARTTNVTAATHSRLVGAPVQAAPLDRTQQAALEAFRSARETFRSAQLAGRHRQRP